MSLPRRDLARKIHQVANGHAAAGRQLHRGRVSNDDPLTIEMHDSRLELMDDEFDIADGMADWADRLTTGDTVLMGHDQGEWMLLEAFSGKSSSDVVNSAMDEAVASLLETVLAEIAGGLTLGPGAGITFTSPDGTMTITLSIDDTGTPVFA